MKNHYAKNAILPILFFIQFYFILTPLDFLFSLLVQMIFFVLENRDNFFPQVGNRDIQ